MSPDLTSNDNVRRDAMPIFGKPAKELLSRNDGVVHFGTITGTMSAIVAGLASFAVVPLIRMYSGHIRTLEINGVREPRYFAGTKRFPLELIR